MFPPNKKSCMKPCYLLFISGFVCSCTLITYCVSKVVCILLLCFNFMIHLSTCPSINTIISFDEPQVTSVFEGLHEGRILCAAAADDNVLLTGGESTVTNKITITIIPPIKSLSVLASVLLYVVLVEFVDR